MRHRVGQRIGGLIMAQSFWWQPGGSGSGSGGAAGVIVDAQGRPIWCADCPCIETGPPCRFCDSGFAPSTLQVEFDGITGQACCDNYNATFLLPYIGEVDEPDPICEWKLDTNYCGDGLFEFVRAILFKSGNDLRLTVQVRTGNLMTWTKDFGEVDTVACADWNALSVPVGFDINTRCDNAGSTCLATAL